MVVSSNFDKYLIGALSTIGGVGVYSVAQRLANMVFAYMSALEKSSVGEDIGPFAEFLADLVEKRLAGDPLPEVPKASS